jgi:hypothetical protein
MTYKIVSKYLNRFLNDDLTRKIYTFLIVDKVRHHETKMKQIIKSINDFYTFKYSPHRLILREEFKNDEMANRTIIKYEELQKTLKHQLDSVNANNSYRNDNIMDTYDVIEEIHNLFGTRNPLYGDEDDDEGRLPDIPYGYEHDYNFIGEIKREIMLNRILI